MQDLEERSVATALHRRGYVGWWPELTYRSPYEAQFRLWGRHAQVAEPQLLMDVRTRQGTVPVGQLTIRALVWEWISLQDPMASFPPGVEPLPGQEHPGLGQFRVLLHMMLDYLREVDAQAVVAIPEFFHNAVLYATHMRFYQARSEGRFQAMQRDLLPFGMARASRAVAAGRVEWDGPPEELWAPAEQVRALVPELEAHFQTREYLDCVAETREQTRYRLCE
jgi:hypothetical protein